MIDYLSKVGRWGVVVWLLVACGLLVLTSLSILFFLVGILGAIEIYVRKEETLWKTIALWHVIFGTYALMASSSKEILFLIFIAIASDVAGLYGGKFFTFFLQKRIRIFPKISPNKTLAGFICGAYFGVLAGLLGAYYLDLSYINSISWLLVRALAQFLAGVAGDCLNSKFKRTYKIKDSGEGMLSGRLSFGHGGVYDRFDNLFAQAILHIFTR